jgi:predicted DNA-binding transcriptional regulator AlpA
MPDHLLNIEDIVRLTGLEESLIRFYESEYPTELPKKILLGGALFFTRQAWRLLPASMQGSRRQ